MLKKIFYTTLFACSVMPIWSFPVEASQRPKVGYVIQDSTQYVDIPGGCGYYLGDWKGNTFAATNDIGNDFGGVFYMYIDGQARYLETTHKSNSLLLAQNSTYEVSVETPEWISDGWETSTSRATLRVTNKHTGATSNLIVEAQEGC